MDIYIYICTHVYIYIYIYIDIDICICVYIYIERERVSTNIGYRLRAHNAYDIGSKDHGTCIETCIYIYI